MATEISTKDSLLKEASLLIQSRGYDSFSFQDLANKVGIKKASVHSHFKDKEELGVRVVQNYIDQFQAWRLYHSHKSGLEQIQSFLKMLKKHYIHNEQLCANGAFFSDWGLLPKRVQLKVLELQKTQIEWIALCLSHARKNNELSFEGDERIRAQSLFVTLVGAIQAARAWADPQTFDSIIQVQFDSLGRKTS